MNTAQAACSYNHQFITVPSLVHHRLNMELKVQVQNFKSNKGE
jgi:hypothetical protein